MLKGTAQLGTSDFARCPARLEYLQGLCLYAGMDPASREHDFVLLSAMLTEYGLTGLFAWVD